MMARLAGTLLALVASLLVHGRAWRRPSISGMSASDPVATTTAWRAASALVEPSAAVTMTSFGPVRRPWPRASEMPAPSTHRTWLSSDQLFVKESRRASTACTSSSPVMAWAAPGTCRAARSTWAERNSAFDGIHAQYEHSPPTSSSSTNTAVKPPWTTRSATFSPATPAPNTITSYSVAPLADWFTAITVPVPAS
jgi:hypothetical protein